MERLPLFSPRGRRVISLLLVGLALLFVGGLGWVTNRTSPPQLVGPLAPLGAPGDRGLASSRTSPGPPLTRYPNGATAGQSTKNDVSPPLRTLKPLPPASLDGAIVLVQRGLCPFETKAELARAAGATGIVFADNREGEANGIPARLPIPGGMVSNLDGARLRDFMAAHGGRTSIRKACARR